ncbi:hypothetical protein ALANTH_1442 [Aliarcobacter lanthieri]|nr:hypothetical protein ALANTH_1442 [Aliarcobacter lanthieri]
MLIKAFLASGRFTFIKVIGFDDIRKVANNYKRWEYVS